MHDTLILESIFTQLGFYMTTWDQTLHGLQQKKPSYNKFHVAIPVNKHTAVNQNKHGHAHD